MGLMTPFQFDLALQHPVFYMMQRGIRIDPQLQTSFAQRAHEEWAKFQGMLDEVAQGPLNVNSDKQVHGYLYFDSDGLGLPPRRKQKRVTADEDALRAIMAGAEHKMRISKTERSKAKWYRVFLSTKLILKIRGERKTLSSYVGCPPECSCKKPSSIKADHDERMRCTISVGGTETMRFSHSKTGWGTGLNMATIPHKIRPMYIADEGYELCEYDLNRGESWVYAFLSEDPELMRIHLSGGDFHAETAAAIQSAFGAKGLTADEIARLAKEGDQFGYKIRYLGKKVNHASSYRMGPFKGAEVVNEEADDTNITVIPSQMKKAQDLWLEKYFGIQGWWNYIDDQVYNKRQLITPYGRVRDYYGYMGDGLKKEATATVPQGTSVDYLNRGMLRVFDELVVKESFGIELLHQNHDSILTQHLIGHRDEIVPEVISRIESKLVIEGVSGKKREITIPVEATYGQNWGDYHEEKNPEGLREWKEA